MQAHMSRDEVQLTLSEEEMGTLQMTGRVEGELAMGPQDRRRIVVVAARSEGGRGAGGDRPSVEQMSAENEPASDI